MSWLNKLREVGFTENALSHERKQIRDLNTQKHCLGFFFNECVDVLHSVTQEITNRIIMKGESWNESESKSGSAESDSESELD